jgi:hypothetical protein
MEHTDVLNFVKGMRVCRFDSYRDNKPEDLARLSYGDLKPLDKHQTPEPTDFLVPDALSGSDYCSSGSVEVSNHRVFLDQFKDSPNMYDVYGGYGTFAVAIRLDSITDEMVEVLNALEDYPVIDEEDLSEVECEAEEETWSNCSMTRREELKAKGFHFFVFTKPEARAEFRERCTRLNVGMFEFEEFEEVHLAKEFKLFFLGVRKLHHVPVKFTPPKETP